MSIGADEVFRLSGVMFSRTSTRSLISGVPYTGIKTFDVSDKREGEIIFGQRTSGQPLGITDGVYSCDDWNMEVYADTYELIMEQLGITPGANLSAGNARFTYTLTISQPGVINMPTLSLTVSGMKLEKRNFALADDASALVWKLGGKALLMTTVGEGVSLSGVSSYLANYLSQ